MFLKNKINDILGDYLIKNKNKFKTIKELRKRKSRVLVIYGDYFQDWNLSEKIKNINSEFIIDGKNLLYKPWPNCQNSNDLIKYF